MDANDFKRRTKAYALRILRLTETVMKDRASSVLGRQLLRSGTSVGANYRAACRAKSRADFVAKMRIVEEECDETLYWLELLIESGKLKEELVSDLMKEGNEILALTVASINTARSSHPGMVNPVAQSAIRNPQSATQ